MPVSASKLVTLAQLQVQAERVKQELAKYTLASELGSLAKKSEISEDDLSAALKSVIDGKMDAADSMTTEAINSAIACIATAKGVTKVINETAMNADVTSTFVKSTVPVEGANGYAAKDYNVWVFEPAVAYGNAAVLKVTLG